MNLLKRGVETLRQPDRNPRCHEMTDEERMAKIKEWAEAQQAILASKSLGVEHV